MPRAPGQLDRDVDKNSAETEMRQKLIDEVKKQGKPYGLYFDDIREVLP